MNQSVFGDTFASITKGLPDLEHVSARIHAKNCCVKDLIKVLGVSLHFMKYMIYRYNTDFELTGLQEA